MDHSKWRHLIGQHLGRKHYWRSWELMVDLVAVDCGLKPALLLDFAVASVACISSLLRALQSAGLLTNRLTVVTIKSDVLVINPASRADSTHQHFHDVTFVDVSGDLEHPQILSESSCSLQHTKNSFLKACERIVDSGTSIDLPVGAEGDQRANPSTLFGLFLGYPAVYYYDMSLDSPDNCLSMVPLVNFVLKGAVAEMTNHRQCIREHVVSSFTIPQSLVCVAESKVNAWFRARKERGLGCELFHELDLERKVVQLPSVCL